jgi:adenine nucleotide transporter 17
MIAEISKNEGIGAFFKGVVPNLILVINPIINFVIYEFLKKFALKKYGSERNIPFSAIFFMSSIGKIVATLFTYPILTVRVRLQADAGKEVSVITAIKKQVSSLGVKGLYHGLEAKLIQTVLYNAFLMMTYEKLRMVIKIMLFKTFYK